MIRTEPDSAPHALQEMLFIGSLPGPAGRIPPTQVLPEQREWTMINRHSPPEPPLAPVDLIAVAVDGRQVILAWTECGAGGLGFRIERADGPGSACPFSEIGGVVQHIAVFHDGSVKPRTTYSYRVYSWNASGHSPPSKAAEVTTQAETEFPSDQE